MATERHNFDEAFTKLVASLRDQAIRSGIISFDEDLIYPFRSTFTPTSPQTLQELGKLLEQNKRLLLRLDGQAIYVIVSIILQFPPSSILSKTIYFLMDTLVIYKEATKTIEALRPCIDVADLEKEATNRRKLIFDPLMKRLREFLTDESKHLKVRRLTGQLIISLCSDNPDGWRGLMRGNDGPCYGRLFRRSNDYILRILVADMIRHLRGQNYDMADIWDHTDEEAMDFPSSQEIKPHTLTKLLASMSGMDLKRAAIHSTSRIYRIKDINIPTRNFHYGASDTLLVLDENIVIVTPDTNTHNTTSRFYEFNVDQYMVVEDMTNVRKSVSLRIIWKQDKGYWVFRGSKSVVTEVWIEFVESNAQHDFFKAFNDAQHRSMLDAEVSHSSQGQVSWRQETQEFTLPPVEFSRESEDDGSSIEDTETKISILPLETAPRAPNPCRKQPQEQQRSEQSQPDGGRNQIQQISSDARIREVDPSSEVFAPAMEEGQNITIPALRFGENENNALSKKLLAERRKTPDKVRNLQTPIFNPEENETENPSRSTSPTKKQGKRKRRSSATMNKTAVEPPSKRLYNDPALSMPLDQSNDSDYASFQNAGAKHVAAPNHDRPKRDQRQRSSEFYRLAANHTQTINQAGQAEPSDLQGGKAEYRGSDQNVPRAAEDSASKTSAVDIHKSSTCQASQARETRASSRAQKADEQSKSSSDVESVPKSKLRSIRKDSRSTMPVKQFASQGKSKKVDKTMNVDWDLDLQDDNEHAEKRKIEPDKKSKPPSDQVLQDSTNTAPRSVNQRGVTTKTRGKKAMKSENPPAPTVGTRRSQRNKAKKSAVYVKSSSSEDDKDDTGRQGGKKIISKTSTDLSPTRQPSDDELMNQQTEIRPIASQMRSDSSTTDLLLSKSLSRHQDALGVQRLDQTDNIDAVKSPILVPSSDQPSRFLDRNAQSKRSDRQNKIQKQGIIATEDGEGDEVAEDSYTTSKLSIPVAPKANLNFGKMLNNFVPTIRATLVDANLQSKRTPFGDPRQFIHNVNSARTSVSPAKSLAAAQPHLHPKRSHERQPARHGEAQRFDKLPVLAVTGVDITNNEIEAQAPSAEEDGTLLRATATVQPQLRLNGEQFSNTHAAKLPRTDRQSSTTIQCNTGMKSPTDHSQVNTIAQSLMPQPQMCTIPNQERHPKVPYHAKNETSCSMKQHSQPIKGKEGAPTRTLTHPAIVHFGADGPTNHRSAVRTEAVAAMPNEHRYSTNRTVDEHSISRLKDKTTTDRDLKAHDENPEITLVDTALNTSNDQFAGIARKSPQPNINCKSVRGSPNRTNARPVHSKGKKQPEMKTITTSFGITRAQRGDQYKGSVLNFDENTIVVNNRGNFESGFATFSKQTGVHDSPKESRSISEIVWQQPQTMPGPSPLPQAFSKSGNYRSSSAQPAEQSAQLIDLQGSPISISSTENVSDNELEAEGSYLDEEEASPEPPNQSRQCTTGFRQTFSVSGSGSRNEQNTISMQEKIAPDLENITKSKLPETGRSSDISKSVQDKPPQATSSSKSIPNDQEPQAIPQAKIQAAAIKPIPKPCKVRVDATLRMNIRPLRSIDIAPPPVPTATEQNHSTQHDAPVENPERHSTDCQQQKPADVELQQVSKTTSKIKRLTAIGDPNTELPLTQPPFTGTPQPFRETLLAQVHHLPKVDTPIAFDTLHLSNDECESGETTLIEPSILLKHIGPRSPSLMSARTSDGSVNLEPHPPLVTLDQSRDIVPRDPRTANTFHRGIERALTVLTKGILIRLEKEEQSAKGLIQRYREGCTETLEELKENAAKRIKHDAMKLISAIDAEQNRTKTAVKMLSKPPVENGQPIEPVTAVSEDDIENYHEKLLNMLDSIGS